MMTGVFIGRVFVERPFDDVSVESDGWKVEEENDCVSGSSVHGAEGRRYLSR